MKTTTDLQHWQQLLAETDGWRLGEIVAWLASDGQRQTDLASFVDGLFSKLRDNGLMISRARMAFLTLHPQVYVRGCTWEPHRGAQVYERGHAIVESDSFRGSPVEYVIEQRKSYRCRLAELVPDEDHGVLFEFAADGGTDYLAAPVIFNDAKVGALLALVTQSEAGFSDADLQRLEVRVQFVTSVLEVF